MKRKKLIILFAIIFGLTFITVLTSVVFSVQRIETYCANATDTELEKRVVKNSGIDIGRSIFLLNEKEITKRIEGRVPEVEVLNIERKFPNCVYVNFVKLDTVYQLQAGGNYYGLSKNGKVLYKNETAFTKDEIIELRLKADSSIKTSLGGYYTDDASELAVLESMYATFESLGLKNGICEKVDFIDVSFNQYVFIKMSSGVCIEVDGWENFNEKLIRAMSLYVEDPNRPDDGVNRQVGTIRVQDSDGAYNASYTPRDLYSEKKYGKVNEETE